MSASISSFAGSVPANYDRYLGPVIFEPYAIDIAGRVAPGQAARVLELACGTGRVTNHLLKKIAPDAKLVATDLNADMISVARQIVTNPRVEWLVADAQDLPFGDASFDLIVCQFGVMFFPDKRKAFAEASRVLVPGGMFLFNVWDDIAANPRSEILNQVMSEVMGADAPDFLSKGPYSYFNEDSIRADLEAGGFGNISFEVVQKTAYYSSVDDIIMGFFEGSPLSAYLTQQAPELRTILREKVRDAIVRNFGEKQILTPMQAIVCTAAK